MPESKEPLEVFADDTTKPSVILDDGQFRKLQEILADHDQAVGLLDAGAGYVKVTLFDKEMNVVEHKLIYAIEP